MTFLAHLNEYKIIGLHIILTLFLLLQSLPTRSVALTVGGRVKHQETMANRGLIIQTAIQKTLN